MFATDSDGDTFLHIATQNASSADIVRHSISSLSRLAARKLAELVNDKYEGTSLESHGLERDWLDQAGSFPLDFYPLPKPPRVLIFYTTADREMGDKNNGANAEKKCVERYFEERNIHYESIEDPTTEVIFSTISAAQAHSDLSGLIVFLMTHGEKGTVRLGKNAEIVSVQHIITHMCCRMNDKPKVCLTFTSFREFIFRTTFTADRSH